MTPLLAQKRDTPVEAEMAFIINNSGYGQPFQSIVLKVGAVGFQVTLDVLNAALGLIISLWIVDRQCIVWPRSRASSRRTFNYWLASAFHKWARRLKLKLSS